MKKNPPKDYTGPLYKIKSPKIQYESEKEKESENLLRNKTENFVINNKTNFKRDIKTNKRVKAGEKMVKSEFVKDILVRNMYYQSRIIDSQETRKLLKLDEVIEFQVTSLNHKFNSAKLQALELELQKEIEKCTKTLRNAKSDGQGNSLQIADLQGTKGLSKFDCWNKDLKPTDWISLCREEESLTNAKCPIFKNNEYVWADAKVIDYDAISDRFHVRIVDSNTSFEKKVIRLSIYFMREDLAQFQYRILKCKQYQSKTDEETRFMRLVESVPEDFIRTLPTSHIQTIQKRVYLGRTKARVMMSDQPILSSMFKVIHANYSHEMKSCFILKQMRDPLKQSFFSEKNVELRAERSKQVRYTTLTSSATPSTFKDKLAQLKARVYYRNTRMMHTLRMFQEKSHEFQKTYLLDLNGFEKRNPFILIDFINSQKEFFDRAKEALRIQWREYLLGDICDILRNIPSFNGVMNDLADYRKPTRLSLEKFLNRIDISFRFYLKKLFDNNCEHYQLFLRQFTVGSETECEPYLISDRPLLYIAMRFADKKKEKTNKGKEIKELKQVKEGNEVDDTNALIFFEPSLDECLERLSQPIKWLVDFIESIECMESDITRMLGIPSRCLLKINENRLNTILKSIATTLKIAFEEPNRMLKSFKAFEFLLEKSKEETVKAYFNDIRKIGSFEVVDEYLVKLSQSITEINSLCANDFKSVFFQIRTAELKEHLIQHASEIKKGILEKISDRVNRSVESTRGEYQELQSQLLRNPEKEEDLVTLNKAIASCEKRMSELDVETEKTYHYITIMEKHGQRFDDKSMIAFWFLKMCPVDVQTSQNEGKRNAMNQQQTFLAKLDDDKRALEIDLASFRSSCEELKKLRKYKDLSESANRIESLGNKLDEAKKRVDDFNRREGLFEIVACKYESLDKLIEDFSPYRQLWDCVFFFDSSRENWMMSQVIKLNYKKISSEIEKYKKTIIQLSKRFEEESNSAPLEICTALKNDIKVFERHMPLIDYLTRDCLTKKPTNWKNLFAQLQITTTQQNDTLALLLNLHIDEKMDAIEDIVLKAEKEYVLEIKLHKEIIDVMKTVKIELIAHKQTGSWILSNVDDFQGLLDQLLNILTIMKQSPYLGSLKRKTDDIEKKLIGAQDLLDEWLKCQRTWIYLSPIFASEDLRKKMPVEKKLFEGVDANWQMIMKTIYADAFIFENFDLEKTKVELESCNRILDQVQKSLSDYLESKRDDFARLYFLSDEELIEIISKTKDPTLITKYLSKCFEGIENIVFSEDKELIESMCSSENETVKLVNAVKVNEGEKRGNVEKWLTELEAEMKNTIKEISRQSFRSVSETSRKDFLFKWPAQVVLAINCVEWTFSVEDALLNASLFDFERKSTDALSFIVDLIKTELSEVDRVTLSSLIVLEVHAKYVVSNLIKKNVRSINDFEWMCQLRHYMSEKEELVIKMMIAQYRYQYEYLGNTNRLVITPLTDRCYQTLISAYQFFYGGAPEGPAGTGKTETVKDLAKVVAVHCNVFNCTDQMNYVSMSKFFKGLSQSGAWCCFDEFNRIGTEVLSVIAEQIRTIQTAVREGKGKFFFEGKHMKLISSCAINITMNPGYAGRSELPDNLKSLFRACAMMIPDYALIAEISLYSNGFQTANSLASKIVAALRLGSEQLSMQRHYDFGMRSLKTILVTAASLKKLMLKSSESVVCLKALNDVNMPKLLPDDIKLFQLIISDLFPDLAEPLATNQILLKSIHDSCSSLQLVESPTLILKTIQFHNTLEVRHGVMLVGDTYSGKSTCISVLQHALRKLNQPTEKYTINPKAVTGLQLYGSLDQNTKVWTEGVIPSIMKLCERDVLKEERKWICFDGPVDAVWIENMNTVLDDNKVICLTNGQKIKLTKWSTMIFEIEDLINASPATVSRTGIIYMESSQLGWQVILNNYIDKLPEVLSVCKETIKLNFNWILSVVLQFMQQAIKTPLKMNKMQLTNNCLMVFSFILKEFEERYSLLLNLKDFTSKIQDLTLYAVVWGVGGVTDEVSRQELNAFLMKMIYFEDVRSTYNLDSVTLNEWAPRGLSLQCKDIKNFFNMQFEIDKMAWTENGTVSIQRGKKMSTNDLLIPTPETQRTSYFIKSMLRNKMNILIVGPTGTGKTVGVLNEIKMNFNNKEIGNLCTLFSGLTNVNTVQRQVESRMTTRKGRKGHFGPEDNKSQLVVFIDDVSMPAKEVYGAQPPIELLRMWLDHGFWYDLETLEPRYLAGINMAVSMGPPSTGRNTVTQRFTRHFYVYYTCPFSYTSMTSIFSSILENHFTSSATKFISQVTSLKDAIVKSTLDIFQKIKSTKELLPTPQKSHYLFSLRDISRVFQTISMASSSSFRSGEGMIKFWAHECSRVVSDRLICVEDQKIFMGILKNTIKSNFKVEYQTLVPQETLLFSDFFNSDGMRVSTRGIFSELEKSEDVKLTFNKILDEFNEINARNENSNMGIVMFTEAIEHVIRALRVISSSNGHCMLVGVGGLGRRIAIMLASFIGEYEYQVLKMTNNFALKDWTEMMQETLREAGINNKKIVFMIRDYQIQNESIWEDISSLLNRGEVAGLFASDEKAKIIEEMSNQPDISLDLSNNEKFDCFVRRCRDNLHLALCFSPVGQNFKRRLRSFPSLINCTTIDWFLDWPSEAYQTVVRCMLKESQLNEAENAIMCMEMVNMHESVCALNSRFKNEQKKYYYVTPMNFIDLNALFVRIYQSRKNEIDTNISRYERGVEILIDSKEKVEQMKEIIIDLEPKLKVANVETEDLIRTVENEHIEAEIKRQNCENEERVCDKDREEAQQLKSYCQTELDAVEPLLEATSKNLKTIQRAHIDFIKTLKIVLPPIMKLFQSLCIFFQVKNVPTVKDQNKKRPDWATCAKNVVMAKPDQMLSYMLDTDAEKINKLPETVILQLKELQKDKDFDIGAIDNVSQAAGKIAGFINTVVEIYDKLQIINPKREALKSAEEKLMQAEKSLSEAKKELAAILSNIAQLNEQLENGKQKKRELELRIQTCKQQLLSAEKLVTGLEGEKVNWSKNIGELKNSKQTILSDVLLSCGVIAYLGVFPVDYRDQIIKTWTKGLNAHLLPLSPTFELRTILSNDILIADWTNKYKLPNDFYSIDNAVIMLNANRYPLIIDPQNQANRWIKMKEKENNLLIMKPSVNPTYFENQLISAIELGHSVLYENAEENLSVIVLSLLENKRKQVGKLTQIKLLDKWINVGKSFKFFVTTKMSKPHFSPNVYLLINILNFQVTSAGLEDQLLNILVSKEDPNSEKARINNVRDFYELKRKQKTTENNILSLLMNSEGNILDNTVLIDTLQKSKSEAKDAVNRMADIEKMKKKLQLTRNFYKKAANRASHLFFCVNDLGMLEPMYQFSLDWFIELYISAINEEPKVRETRVDNIISTFLKMLFAHVSPSLFSKDKLLFALLVYLKLLLCEEIITEIHVRKLFAGCTNIKLQEANTLSEILTDKQFIAINELSESFTNFKKIVEMIADNKQALSSIMEDANPQMRRFPDVFYNRLNEVEQLMIFKILLPNKFQLMLQQKIMSKLGSEFVENQNFNLENIFRESKNTTPIIFILSPGSDPLNDISQLSIQIGKAKNVDVLSLGQGQEAVAQKFIEQAQMKGRWVVLQNCHLAPRILSILEKSLDEPNQNPEFRLWLTSMPSDKFPVSLLQMGMKITNEPPRGIKANLMKNLSLFGQKYLEHQKSAEWRKMLFSLTMFHSIVQERRKFGAIGWNIAYEFSQNDLLISATQMRLMLSNYDEIPWKSLLYMIGETNYGGRVTDKQDRRLVNSILTKFINPAVLENNHVYYKNYEWPNELEMNEIVQKIKDKYPLNDSPEIFGLHENAEISSGIRETNELMSSLLNLVPRTQTFEGKTPDQIVASKCIQLLSQMPNQFEVEKVKQRYQVSYDNSMNSVLIQELVKYNRLNDKITSSLKQLQSAIEGMIMMSEELDEMYSKILNNGVPETWHIYAYSSCKPLMSWMHNLYERLKFFQDWIAEGQPKTFWISGFFFPQSFITGIMQNFARKTKVPFDMVDFEFEFLREFKEGNGECIYGLFVEGAELNENEFKLEQSKPKVLFKSVPLMRLNPVEKSSKKSVHCYNCPVYKTSKRSGTLSSTGHSTNYILSVEVPINEKESEEIWIEQGVAMLCSLDD